MKAKIFLAFLLVVTTLLAEPKKALNIPTISAKNGEVASEKEFLATTVFAEDKVCQVSAKFGGFVENLYADSKYKFVRKGETLFDVFSPELVSAVNEAIKVNAYAKDNDAPSAKAMLDASLQRLRYLGLSDDEIGAQLAKPQADRLIKFKSPCSGAISEKEIFKGSGFAAGQKLLSIVDNSSLWLEIKVYENDIKNIRTGQGVDAVLNGFDGNIKARIIKILPEINPKDRSVTARAIIQNPSGRISANMFGKAKITTSKEGGIVLPKTAVLEKNGKFFVFMAQAGGKFEPVEISAKKVGLNYLVKSGLNVGDQVANGALFMLDSDAKVQGLY
jgi:membrane fusion protein, copper/silver efflux system